MLNKKIRETIQRLRETLPPELTALIEQGAGEISALDIIGNAKKVGDKAPLFELKNQHGASISLARLLERGPCVVTFYRGVWCPYCNLQLKAYADSINDIRTMGANLVALSPERPDALDILKTSIVPQDVIDTATTSVPFDILHDHENRVARQFGIVFDLPKSHRELLRMMGIDLESMTNSKSHAFPDPATYLVAPDATIRWAFVPNNYRRRAEVSEILTALQTTL